MCVLGGSSCSSSSYFFSAAVFARRERESLLQAANPPDSIPYAPKKKEAGFSVEKDVTFLNENLYSSNRLLLARADLEVYCL